MSAKKNGLLTAPYDSNGNLREYTGYGNTEWRPNTPFRNTLYYKGYERGRSAARIMWEDDEGREYPMFLSSFDEIMLAGRVGVSSHTTSAGNTWGSCVVGEWQIVKRGANYGIALVIA